MKNYRLKFITNELFKESVIDSNQYITALIENEPYSPSGLEKYSFTVMGWIQRLSNCFKDLEHTRVYMSHFRSNKWYKEAGITQSNCINYHYVKYATTVVTISDVCLILTNDICRLGNPERLCYLENITRNSWIVSSKIDKSLNKIMKAIEPWREPRNLFIHRGWEMYREALTMLDAYELLQGKGIFNRSAHPQRIKTLYKSELSKIFKEFDSIEAPLFNAVIELMSKLLPVYKSWRKKL